MVISKNNTQASHVLFPYSIYNIRIIFYVQIYYGTLLRKINKARLTHDIKEKNNHQPC